MKDSNGGKKAVESYLTIPENNKKNLILRNDTEGRKKKGKDMRHILK